MFKNEISFIYDLNINKLQLLGDRVTIKDLKRSNIHPALIHYIDANIDSEIFYDRKKIETDSIFNYTSDRINNYFSLISEEIKRIQIFNTRDIKQVLQKGIIFNINYLTQPNKTLTKLVFNNGDVKSTEEIIIAVSHAYYYRYLKKILFTYIEKKKILLMRRDEFYSLLLRIDEISRETHLEETLTTAVNSMINFFDPQAKGSEKLPLEAVTRYLEEKRLPEFQNRLENKFGMEGSILLSANEIISELRSVTPEAELEINVQDQEDELIVDTSEEVMVDSDSLTTESMEIEETDLREEQSEPSHEEIFEVEEDELEIPNHQILSEDDFSSENKQFEETATDEDIEENKIIDNEAEDIPDDQSQDENIIDQNDLDDNLTSDEDLKKKPESVPLLRKLIDINSIYESLLPDLKPFDAFTEKYEGTLKDSAIFDELNYLHDQSTIAEEISIATKSIESSEKIKTESAISEEEVVSSHDEELISTESNDINLENDDLNLSIDEVVADERIEDEFILENKSIEAVEQDITEADSDQNLLSEEKITLVDDEEELTEVFTDLAFLDKEEDFSEVIDETENKNSSIPEDSTIDESEEISEGKSLTIYSNIMELLSQNDMTKIIEHIFDYDMEDYHYLVDCISNTTNEDEAFNYIDNYCKENHIDITSHEVEHFKSLIYDYFTQTYS